MSPLCYKSPQEIFSTTTVLHLMWSCLARVVGEDRYRYIDKSGCQPYRQDEEQNLCNLPAPAAACIYFLKAPRGDRKLRKIGLFLIQANVVLVLSKWCIILLSLGADATLGCESVRDLEWRMLKSFRKMETYFFIFFKRLHPSGTLLGSPLLPCSLPVAYRTDSLRIIGYIFVFSSGKSY